MSVRGYIVEEDMIWVENGTNTISKLYPKDDENWKSYTHKERTYCLNAWSQSDLANEIAIYGVCTLNDDFVGEIEIDDEMWIELCDNYNFKSKEDIESKRIIDEHFRKSDGFLIIEFF